MNADAEMGPQKIGKYAMMLALAVVAAAGGDDVIHLPP